MRTLVAVFGVVLLANIAFAGEAVVLKNERDKISYGIGMDIGENMKKQSIDIDPDKLAQGIKDVFSGGKLLMTEEEFRNTMENFRKDMMAKQKMQMQDVSDKNKKEGEAFLTENKKKEGVKTLPSGLQYKVIKEGDGNLPKAEDTVQCITRALCWTGLNLTAHTAAENRQHSRSTVLSADGPRHSSL